MVEFIDVFKSFGTAIVIDGLSFKIVPDAINQILGPQSSGKSTVIKLIYGAVKPTSGTVRVFDTDIASLNYSGLVLLRRYIGIIFEDVRLLRGVTARENITIISRLTGKSVCLVDETFDMLGITKLSNKYPKELSLGEQSLVGIARSIAFNFPLVIADEPFRYLAANNKKMVLDVFRYLSKKRKMTFLIATQNSLSDDFNTFRIDNNETG